MALPVPQHRIDEVALYVLEVDDAWDHDRIASERAKLEKGKKHPVTLYHEGKTRCALSEVKSYLDDVKLPCMFELSRLNIDQWQSCQSLLVGHSRIRAGVFALRHALTETHNAPKALAKFKRFDRDDGPLDDDDLKAIRETIGDELFEQLCDMSICVSRELSPSEKKP